MAGSLLRGRLVRMDEVVGENGGEEGCGDEDGDHGLFLLSLYLPSSKRKRAASRKSLILLKCVSRGAEDRYSAVWRNASPDRPA